MSERRQLSWWVPAILAVLLVIGGIWTAKLWSRIAEEDKAAEAQAKDSARQDLLKRLYEERKAYLISLVLSGEEPSKLPQREWEEELCRRCKLQPDELTGLVDEALKGSDPVLAAKARLISGEREEAAFDALQIQLNAGVDPMVKREAMRVESLARFERSEWKTFLELAEKASDMYRFREDVAAWADARADVALMMMGEGRHADADNLLWSLKGRVEESLGAKHPVLARILDLYAASSVALNHLSSAESALRQVIAIREETLGPNDPEIAAMLQRMIEIESRKSGDGRFLEQGFLGAAGSDDETVRLHRRRHEILEHNYGALDPKVLSAAGEAGRNFYLRGKPKEAEPFLRKAVAGEIGAGDKKGLNRLNLLGDALAAQGDHKAAEEIYQRELGIRTSKDAPPDMDARDCRFDLAKICRATGRLKEATEAMETLVKQADGTSKNERERFRVVVWNYSLSTLLTKQGCHEDAKLFDDRAVAEMDEFAAVTKEDFSIELYTHAVTGMMQGSLSEALIFHRLGVEHLLRVRKKTGEMQPNEADIIKDYTTLLIRTGTAPGATESIVRGLYRDAGLGQ